jgi:type I restriction-modification system DNA methylase subunit
MPKTKQSSTAWTHDGATISYETWLWHMAEAPRGCMDAAEYKHAALSLISLQYISDTFQATDGSFFGCFGGNK